MYAKFCYWEEPGFKWTLGSDKVYIGNLDLFESLDEKKPSKEIEEKVKSYHEVSGILH